MENGIGLVKLMGRYSGKLLFSVGITLGVLVCFTPSS